MEELQEKGYDCSFSVVSPEEIVIRLSEIQELEEVDTTADVRYHTGVGELDRVLGGGLVRGSIVLLGGEPGIGKVFCMLPKDD